MEADEHHDHDSTFGGDDGASMASSSTSLRSSIMRHQHEHGRRYHGYKEGMYPFPNDEKELDRMDIEHAAQLLHHDGKLHLCPLPEHADEILDLGTGTGIWAIDMADQHPSCRILGTDLSATQPSWVPPNCRFEIDDFNEEWTFGSDRFDMIHARILIGSIASHADVYKRCYEALKPGGYLEVCELDIHWYSDDGTVKPDSALARWGHLLEESFLKMGRKIPRIEEYEGMLKDVGFEDVHFTLFKRPSSDWPKDPRMKELGRYTCLGWLEGVEGYTLAPFTRLLGWSPEEVQVFVAHTRKELVKRSIHGYNKGWVDLISPIVGGEC